MPRKKPRQFKPNWKKTLLLTAAALLLGSKNISNYELEKKQEKQKLQEPIVITAVGDVTLAYHFNEWFEKLKAEKGDAAYELPFSQVKHYLEDSITIANLECALTEHDKKVPKKFSFRGKPEYAKCLALGSIELVNLANNHSLDYGSKGLEDTLKALEKENIMWCGAGATIEKAREAKILESNGTRLAFLGYTDVGKEFCAGKKAGNAPCLEDYIKEDVKAARKIADIVIVSFHYGKELAKFPSSRQRFLSRLAIDSGANIIIGHHPHVLQEVEHYKQGLIFYSLGNFCFGGNSKHTDSAIAKIVVSKTDIKNYELFYELLPVRTGKQGSFMPFLAK